jgi:hypothetical protein
MLVASTFDRGFDTAPGNSVCGESDVRMAKTTRSDEYHKWSCSQTVAEVLWDDDDPKPKSHLLIYIERVEMVYYLSRQHPRYTIAHRQRPSPRSKATPGPRQLELADDSREPPGTITLLHGKLVAKVRMLR